MTDKKEKKQKAYLKKAKAFIRPKHDAIHGTEKKSFG
jgi:hypothetical protein